MHEEREWLELARVFFIREAQRFRVARAREGEQAGTQVPLPVAVAEMDALRADVLVPLVRRIRVGRGEELPEDADAVKHGDDP